MHDPSLQDAIKEAYATAGADEPILHTLEMRHPSFLDDDGNAVAVRVVADQEDLTAQLEADAPLNGGEYVTFTAAAFEFKLPQVDDGGLPQIEIAMDNVTQILMPYLREAASSTEVAEVTYRPYLPSDLTTPQMDPPLTLELTNVQANLFRVSGRAQFKILHNVPFPNKRYTLEDYPSLV